MRRGSGAHENTVRNSLLRIVDLLDPLQNTLRSINTSGPSIILPVLSDYALLQMNPSLTSAVADLTHPEDPDSDEPYDAAEVGLRSLVKLMADRHYYEELLRTISLEHRHATPEQQVVLTLWQDRALDVLARHFEGIPPFRFTYRTIIEAGAIDTILSDVSGQVQEAITKIPHRNLVGTRANARGLNENSKAALYTLLKDLPTDLKTYARTLAHIRNCIRLIQTSFLKCYTFERRGTLSTNRHFLSEGLSSAPVTSIKFAGGRSTPETGFSRDSLNGNQPTGNPVTRIEILALLPPIGQIQILIGVAIQPMS